MLRISTEHKIGQPCIEKHMYPGRTCYSFPVDKNTIYGPISVHFSRGIDPMDLIRPELIDAYIRAFCGRKTEKTSDPTRPENAFGGYVVTSEDPLKELIRLSYNYIPGFWDDSGSEVPFRKPARRLARVSKQIEKFINKIVSGEVLSPKDMYRGDTLIRLLLARFRAHETMESKDPNNAKLIKQYRALIQTLCTKVHPKHEFAQLEDGKNALIRILSINESEIPGIIPYDNKVPLQEDEQLIAQLLSVLNRFGDPISRAWIATHPNNIR